MDLCSHVSASEACLSVSSSRQIGATWHRPALSLQPRFLALSRPRTFSSPPLRISRIMPPLKIQASVSDAAPTALEDKPQPNVFQKFLSALASFWKQMILPLGNFGFGKRSIWEGGVGLFLVSGACMFAVLLGWIRGFQLRARSDPYRATIEFSQACGIAVGTPVRIRGVNVGSVVGVQPSLQRIDVNVELSDATVVIPRNALVEVNQSGLISETLIDITPQIPLPNPTVGPLNPRCKGEGLIVCDRERIVGQQGVSLDELVGICTKLARQMDKGGMDNMFEAVNRVSLVVEEARPLLDKITQMSHDLQPLMKDIRDGELLRNLESLTKVATEAAGDLRALNSAVLTGENTELLRQSVATLTRTLQHVESISSDLSGLTGDSSTRHNLRQLIESLSRLVND